MRAVYGFGDDQPASLETAFANLVAGSHRIAVGAEVLFGGEVLNVEVPIVGGWVDYDRGAARLARASVQIADPVRLPLTSSDVFTPFGYELRLWRGVAIGTIPNPALWLGDTVTWLGVPASWGTTDGAVLMVPLGTFPILDSNLDGVSLLTSLTMEDRSFRVAMARFEDDYQVAAGTNYADAIEALIDDGVPGLEYLFPSTEFTTPLLTFSATDDRWVAAQSMASSIGMDLHFDGLGRVVMRPEPTFATDPVAVLAEGVNLTAINVGLSRRQAVNRVVAFSTNASLTDQYRGVATDDDPSSPTYYDGPFGAQVEFFASPLLASDAQCELAAQTVLARKLGIAASLAWGAVPDPRLECGDVVAVTRQALGLDQDIHIIETMSIGLGPESPMVGTTRTRQVTT